MTRDLVKTKQRFRRFIDLFDMIGGILKEALRLSPR